MHTGKTAVASLSTHVDWKLGLGMTGCRLQEEGYVTADVADKKGLHQLKLSGTKFRQMLRAGEGIPEWFAFKSVVQVLREASNTNGSS